MGKRILVSLLILCLLFAAAGMKATYVRAEENPAEEDEGSNDLELELIASIEAEDKQVATSRYDGYTYRVDDKFGVMDYTGENDTGAVYASVSYEGAFYAVTQDDSEMEAEPESLNRYGIIDASGRVIVPEEYAGFRATGSRYMVAIKVNEITEDEDEAIMYFTSKLFSLSPDEDDILFTGEWVVFDTVTGELVPEVSGTDAYWPSARGDFLEYRAEDGQYHTIYPDGRELDSSARLQGNGTYIIEDDNVSTVYDSEDNEIFSVETGDYDLEYYGDSGYYLEKYEDGEYTYYLLNETGEVVSAAFPYIREVVGPYVVSKEDDIYMLYDKQGLKILEDPVSYGNEYDIYCDRMAVISLDEGGYVFLDTEGNVLLECDDEVDVYDFTACKEIDGEDYYYNFAEQDYTIKGLFRVGPMLVETKLEEGGYELIDTFTGEVLLSGYGDYSVNEATDGTYWILAEKSDEKAWDIFEINTPHSLAAEE